MSERRGMGIGPSRSGVFSSSWYGCRMRTDRKAVSPVTRMLMKKPAMIWSTRYRMARTASRSARSAADEDRPAAIPSHGLSKAAGDDRGDEGPRQEHALDGDVHHAGALAEHARERTEHDRDRALDGASAGRRSGSSTGPAATHVRKAETNGEGDQAEHGRPARAEAAGQLDGRRRRRRRPPGGRRSSPTGRTRFGSVIGAGCRR